MTKRINPEIKAMRALVRAFQPLTAEQRQRDLEWFVAQQCGLVFYSLPPVATSATAADAASEVSSPRIGALTSDVA